MLGDKKCNSTYMGIRCDGCEGHYGLPNSPHFQSIGVNNTTWTDDMVVATSASAPTATVKEEFVVTSTGFAGNSEGVGEYNIYLKHADGRRIILRYNDVRDRKFQLGEVILVQATM